MSRVADRASKRAGAVRNEARPADAVARYWRAEADRARVATRLRELGARLRTGSYAGRADDVAAADRLWAALGTGTR